MTFAAFYRSTPSLQRQQGATLIVSLLMLLVVLILAVSLAQLSLQNEKSARNDRDRQIALNAAEAALKDAEVDIDPATPSAQSRASLFNPRSIMNFEAGCGAGDSYAFQGMCLPGSDVAPVWQTVDLSDSSAGSRSVAFGRFTGQVMSVGNGPLPAKLPRYIIEVLQDVEPGQAADGDARYLYRITAIGFGVNENTRVVLQSFYRKVLRS